MVKSTITHGTQQFLWYPSTDGKKCAERLYEGRWLATNGESDRSHKKMLWRKLVIASIWLWELSWRHHPSLNNIRSQGTVQSRALKLTVDQITIQSGCSRWRCVCSTWLCKIWNPTTCFLRQNEAQQASNFGSGNPPGPPGNGSSLDDTNMIPTICGSLGPINIFDPGNNHQLIYFPKFLFVYIIIFDVSSACFFVVFAGKTW